MKKTGEGSLMKAIKVFVYTLILGMSFFVYSLNVYATSPIQIFSVVDLSSITDMDEDYELMNDLDLSNLTVTPFENFTGEFDGNGYTLSHFNYRSDLNIANVDVGLFISIDGANIHDLNISDFNYSITAGTSNYPINAGILVGNSNDSTISNITISDSLISSTLPITTGGLVGTTFDGSVSNVIIDHVELSNSGAYLGGAIGTLVIYDSDSVSVSNVHTNIVAQGGSHIGGVFGVAYGMYGDFSDLETLNISNISSRGTITGVDNLGGIFGDIILENLVAENVTTKIHQVAIDGGSSNDVFHGLSASSEIFNYSINKLLIQSTFENQTNGTLVANAFMDTTPLMDEEPNDRTLTNAYYIDGLGFSSSSLSVLSQNDSRLQSSYPTFDFDSTWVMHPLFNDGLPYLRYPTKTLNFDSNGGSLVSDQPYFPNEGSLAPSDPSLSGYTFNAWTLNDQVFDFSSTSYGSNISLLATYSVIPVDTNTNTPTQLPTISNQEPIPETGQRREAFLMIVLGFILLLLVHPTKE
jgi:hypothetical protein